MSRSYVLVGSTYVRTDCVEAVTFDHQEEKSFVVFSLSNGTTLREEMTGLTEERLMSLLVEVPED